MLPERWGHERPVAEADHIRQDAKQTNEAGDYPHGLGHPGKGIPADTSMQCIHHAGHVHRREVEGCGGGHEGGWGREHIFTRPPSASSMHKYWCVCVCVCANAPRSSPQHKACPLLNMSIDKHPAQPNTLHELDVRVSTRRCHLSRCRTVSMVRAREGASAEQPPKHRAELALRMRELEEHRCNRRDEGRNAEIWHQTITSAPMSISTHTLLHKFRNIGRPPFGLRPCPTLNVWAAYRGTGRWLVSRSEAKPEHKACRQDGVTARRLQKPPAERLRCYGVCIRKRCVKSTGATRGHIASNISPNCSRGAVPSKRETASKPCSWPFCIGFVEPMTGTRWSTRKSWREGPRAVLCKGPTSPPQRRTPRG